MDHAMTRRDFVKITGSAAAVTALGVPAIGDEAPRAIRKAVKLGMVQVDGSLLDKFTLLKQLGFDGVEPSSPNNHDNDEMIAARDATGLDIHGVVNSLHWKKPFSSPDPAIRAAGRDGLETALRDCKAYGGTSVLVVPAVVNKQTSYADAYRRSQDEIRRVLPLAEEMDIRILFENVWNNFLLSPIEAARYVDEFESDHIGWYFDVGNVVNYGWPEHWISTLGKRIVKLDIKEFSKKRRDDEGLWKGFGVKLLEGDCDWPTVMQTLDHVGYSGWATAEIAGGGPERLAEIAERMDRIFAS